MEKQKLAFLISHPTQYHSPLFREIAKSPEIDLTVYFFSKIGLGEKYDKTYERVLKWDTPILEGYNYIFLKNPLQIFRELKKNRYGALIVHGYNLLTHWFAFVGARFTKTPLILKGEADLAKNISGFKKVFKKVILKFIFKQAAAFLYSYGLNKEFFKYYGAPEERLFFCPSAVDNDFWREKHEELKGEKEKIKSELGIKNKELPVVLFVGQFIQRKRVIDLLEAVKVLKGRISFNVLLVGEGEEKENLIQIVRDNELEENIYFFGFKNQSELPKIYTIADIFVLPSEYDPSPKALQEVLNFGLPVIVSSGVKTAPGIVLKGDCGFIYPAGDISKLTEYIEKLISDDKLRLEFGKNALAVILKWSYKEDVKGILQAIQYVKSKS